MGAIIVSPYTGVPKGVAMFSFRMDIPKGIVVLDGKKHENGNDKLWPEEN